MTISTHLCGEVNGLVFAHHASHACLHSVELLLGQGLGRDNSHLYGDEINKIIMCVSVSLSVSVSMSVSVSIGVRLCPCSP
jgi:hypothetical protein